MTVPEWRPLPRGFFARDTLTVARELIGCVLWTAIGSEVTAGRIVEVEAYLGLDDPASHAAGGPTPRSAIMFGAPGTAYVYLSYGVHHCLNAVTETAGRAGAVLLRALEPEVGETVMVGRRGGVSRPPAGLCGGPGRLCQALGVDRGWNGLPLNGRRRANDREGRRVWFAEGARPPVRLVAAPRIGIRRAVDCLYRFCDADSSCLSVRVPAGAEVF